MSVKTTTGATTVALVLVGALGLYYFGRGGKLDTSKDRDILLHVEYKLKRPAPAGVLVFVTINEAGRSVDASDLSPWDDHMWLVPGETVRLFAKTEGVGTLTCRITDKGKEIEDTVLSRVFEDLSCAVSVTG